MVPPLQIEHGPASQAVSQQYPSTQWPEAHSRHGGDWQSLAPQVPPAGFWARQAPTAAQ
jgi:hypothetical protein